MDEPRYHLGSVCLLYTSETGSYGALGHGVSSLDGTQLLMMQSGYLVRLSVAEIRAGTRGTPGELHGLFDVTATVGTVDKNTAVSYTHLDVYKRQGIFQPDRHVRHEPRRSGYDPHLLRR